MRCAGLALLCILGGVITALALPLALPFISLRELNPAGHLEWLAWIGLVPTLFALDRARSAKGAFGIGFLSGTTYFYVAIWWVSHAMTAFGGLSFPLAFTGLSLLVYFMAAHWGGCYAVAWLVRRRMGWRSWWHMPVIWATFELVRNYMCTGFPWANLGYIQARHLAISQLASLFGIYAIAALVLLVNCAIHAAITQLREQEAIGWRSLAPHGATAVLLALVVTYGELHLRSVRREMAAAPTLRVGLVQGNINQSVKNAGQDNAAFILGRFDPLTAEADRAGADLIVWPEATYPYHLRPDTASLEGKGLPLLTHAHLVLGAATVEWKSDATGRRYPEVTNSAFLIEPGLKVVRRYTKHHLVPFGEYVPLAKYLGFLKSVVPEFAPAVPGGELVTLDFDDGRGDPVRVAPEICYDAIFPEINVAFARMDPDLMLNPTNDAWYGYSSGPYQFLALVRLRAIEAKRAFARPAYAGVTAVVLPTGEIAPGAIDVGPVDPDLAPDPEEPPRLLVADVPRLHGRTVYTSIGDAFAYACSLATAGAFLFALFAPRRR